MQAIDIFAGCGGMGLGFLQAELGPTLAAYDWGEEACTDYERMIQKPIQQVDLAKYDLTKLPDADIIFGGPPCQDFSAANSARPGDAGIKNLWPATIKAVEIKRPSYFLFENVTGLVRLYPAYFQFILKSFTDLGYIVDWRLLNAADYGVPQTRERLFIAGWLPGQKKWGWPQVDHYPFPDQAQSSFWNIIQNRWVSWDEALTGAGWFDLGHKETKLPEWVLAKYPNKLAPNGYYDCQNMNKGGKQFRRFGQPAFTVVVGRHGSVRIKIDDGSVFRLDAVGKCILQTLPTYETARPLSDVSIGNAVPPLLAQRIFEAQN